MDHYVSEDEQVEAIKKWWKANGGAIIVGIVIGLLVIFGWQYWSSYRINQAEQAALRYAALNQAIEENDTDRARQEGRVLMEAFSNSAYATLAAFQLTKLAIQERDNATAIARLEWALEHSHHQDSMKDIIRLRLARVLLAEERYDAAEALLNQVTDTSFTAELENLKGDLYVARNQLAKARAAYQAALGASGGNVMLQMKLENLPPATQASQE
jgi:predicted negative regulator of RcsB-dependent stress response